jgi:DnaJ-class molecular chaperone
MATEPTPHPGDQVPPSAPGAAEAVCRKCAGSGTVEGKQCPDCEGTGKVMEGIGGG